jgi:hypothetical protein
VAEQQEQSFLRREIEPALSVGLDAGGLQEPLGASLIR